MTRNQDKKEWMVKGGSNPEWDRGRKTVGKEKKGIEDEREGINRE
ncbi:MAG: hypothetical protein ABIJ56_03580 [Pseudomonadota bacterium]